MAGRANPTPKPSIHRAIAAAAEIVDADVGEAELAVMLTDDAGIRTLNSNWRGIDKPTNVLSFPALQPTGAGGPDDAPRMLGDIAIAYETTRKEADDEQKPFDHHLSHLAVHGFLHLIGYDHEKDDDAEAMEALERRFWRNSAFPIRMRIGSGWTEMADSEPTHDNPRNTRNLPAVVQEGEVAAPRRRQLADAGDPHAVRMEAGIGPRRSAGRARCLHAGRGGLFRHRAHHAAQHPRPA